MLNIGYAEAGPPDGPPVILLHGWPYDIHDYIEVAPILVAQGYRVIVPHLRGHGSTRFLDPATPRAGQQAVIGMDVIALMDALNIPAAVLAGYDWGGRAACIVAALWPERCNGLVSVNDYLIQDIAHAGNPLPPKLEWGIWTQFYFATERGRAGLAANRNDIARLLWTTENPTWHYDDAAFLAKRRFMGKSGLCRRGDPLLSASSRPGARLSAICGCRGEASGATGDHGAHRHTRRGGQWHHPSQRRPVFRGQVLRQTNPPSGS